VILLREVIMLLTTRITEAVLYILRKLKVDTSDKDRVLINPPFFILNRIENVALSEVIEGVLTYFHVYTNTDDIILIGSEIFEDYEKVLYKNCYYIVEKRWGINFSDVDILGFKEYPLSSGKKVMLSKLLTENNSHIINIGEIKPPSMKFSAVANVLINLLSPKDRVALLRDESQVYEILSSIDKKILANIGFTYVDYYNCYLLIGTRNLYILDALIAAIYSMPILTVPYIREAMDDEVISRQLFYDINIYGTPLELVRCAMKKRKRSYIEEEYW